MKVRNTVAVIAAAILFTGCVTNPHTGQPLTGEEFAANFARGALIGAAVLNATAAAQAAHRPPPPPHTVRVRTMCHRVGHIVQCF